jgi:holin-like protein
MIAALARIVALLVLGETLVEVLAIPIPGAALGLLALTAIFASTGGPDRETAAAFDAISKHVPLCFVPAAVGVIASLDELSQMWASAVVAVVLGSAATLLVVGHIAQAILRPARGGSRA